MTIDPLEREGDSRQRVEDLLKTPYDVDDDGWQAFIEATATEVEDVEQELSQILSEKFVSSASGTRLDRLATLVDVERRTGESDDLFRARTQVALRQLLASATIAEIRETIAVLLDLEVDEVAIEEEVAGSDVGIDEGTASITVGVDPSVLEDREITVAQFIEVLEGLVAAGVSVRRLFASGSFAHTGVGRDTHDPDRGYGSVYDEDVGGTYAAIIT